MPDTSVLNRLFNDRAKIPIDDYYGKKKVVLKEPQVEDSMIEIRGIPDDAIVIDLDRAFSNEKLFAGSQGECKRADYIIFSEQRKKVLFIEMKKTGAKLNDIVKQLKGSLCAFEYCQSIAREFFNENNFLSAYECRFITINHTGMSNRTTTIEKIAGTNNRPDAPLKLSWTQTIQFNQIAK
ncbi:hypothetical protein [Marinomonas foliarum]|uniref:Type I restriction enzyme R protein N-terminal domain-containing protein n=1 Tax=Marinomonas foliarum TaxID=491950 RepID=A0ABX7IQZ3_9GAMM|nr:hypothetical protein [Marinomonas foliarum]QRV23372.1 hypothetical protein JSY38_15145 [Marinomonas foliarum]